MSVEESPQTLAFDVLFCQQFVLPGIEQNILGDCNTYTRVRLHRIFFLRDLTNYLQMKDVFFYGQGTKLHIIIAQQNTRSFPSINYSTHMLVFSTASCIFQKRKFVKGKLSPTQDILSFPINLWISLSLSICSVSMRFLSFLSWHLTAMVLVSDILLSFRCKEACFCSCWNAQIFHTSNWSVHVNSENPFVSSFAVLQLHSEI